MQKNVSAAVGAGWRVGFWNEGRFAPWGIRYLNLSARASCALGAFRLEDPENPFRISLAYSRSSHAFSQAPSLRRLAFFLVTQDDYTNLTALVPSHVHFLELLI